MRGRITKRRGLAIILTALMLVWMVPMVGLAVDVSLMYAIKARLSAACDAAAMASARALSVGLTLSEQEASALTRAQAFFEANFASGAFETTSTTVQAAVAETGLHTRTVTVSASTAAPMYFMQFLGKDKGWINATGKTSRRDVNVMMVIDRSGSLQTAGACDDVETASTAFVGLFANSRDRLGLITYGGSYKLDYAPTKNFKNSPTLVSTLDLLHPGGCNGWTGSAQALWKGYEEIVTINEPGALNVILFFTDGQPNAITNDWPVRTVYSDSYGPSRCWDWEHGVSYTSPSWNPSTQKYRGFFAEGPDGIRGHDADLMPVSGDPGYVAIPVGYSGTAKSTSSDCYFRSNSSSVREDIPYFPNTDLYGNSMFGYKTVSTYSSGPWAGKVRINSSTTRANVAINALDNAADRIRNKELNSGIDTVLYVIGLGGVGEAEDELLRRVANSIDSPIYDQNDPEGLYVFAPTATQLNLAFVRIASEILRYAQ